MARSLAEPRCLLSPGVVETPVMDALCSHFVLTLMLRHAGRFNLRRDCSSLLSLVGRIWCGHNPCWRVCAAFCAGAARATCSERVTRR